MKRTKACNAHDDRAEEDSFSIQKEGFLLGSDEVPFGEVRAACDKLPYTDVGERRVLTRFIAPSNSLKSTWALPFLFLDVCPFSWIRM